MKKIAIFTLNGNYNFGNRLQNYALQEILQFFGFSVETVINNSDYVDSQDNKLSTVQKLRIISDHSCLNVLRIIAKIIKRKIFKRKYEKLYKQKIERFQLFSKKYINETNYSISYKRVPENLGSLYDYYITGSDQVWNPFVRKGSPIDFLTFASTNRKIAYAPSFGVSKIPNEYVSIYKNMLNTFKYISVREEDGAKIIKELTGKVAPVLADPTLLISKNEWLKISKESTNKPNRNYLLTYFIGNFSSEYSRQIKVWSKKYELEIVHLGQKEFGKYFATDPSEFIDFINGCSVFCTDSFHGTVFSILLEKPFIVFERIGAIGMNSRLETLLEKYNFYSRRFCEFDNDRNIFSIDFSHVPTILESERKKSIEFLLDALSSEGKEST